MYREPMHELHVASSSGQAPPRVLLDGPSGSGKSVALAAQVARVRAAGALVLYVPSAFALMQDAFFSRCHPDAAPCAQSDPNQS
jgi:ABC-type iron transport system FetAB ATPase subunit